MDGVGIPLWMLLWWSTFIFHTNYREKRFVHLFHDYIADVHYDVQSDNMISVVIHDTYLWHWMLPENAKSVMDYFYLSVVINAL